MPAPSRPAPHGRSARRCHSGRVSGDDLRVRPVEPGDGDAVAGLLGVLGYPTSPAEARARMARLERVEGARVLVAELGGAVVGLIALCLTHLIERERPSCRITALGVQPHARRSGVATALLGAAEAEARRLGCFRVEVTCRPERREAHRLYERRGFSEQPRRFVKELG
jgi:GNAT superfamily N-acetyltransferase